jgi:hypothetical protein
MAEHQNGWITSSKCLIFEENMFNDICSEIRSIGVQMDRHDLYVMCLFLVIILRLLYAAPSAAVSF